MLRELNDPAARLFQAVQRSQVSRLPNRALSGSRARFADRRRVSSLRCGQLRGLVASLFPSLSGEAAAYRKGDADNELAAGCTASQRTAAAISSPAEAADRGRGSYLGSVHSRLAVMSATIGVPRCRPRQAPLRCCARTRATAPRAAAFSYPAALDQASRLRRLTYDRDDGRRLDLGYPRHCRDR